MTDPADLDDQLAAAYAERARITREYQALQAALDEVTQRIADLEAQRAGALQNAKRSSKVGGMTSAQRRERAAAIGAASRPRDKFQLAVQGSKWGSANRYARERLKISPAMLSRYRAGDYNVPDAVAAMVFEDLGVKLGK